MPISSVNFKPQRTQTSPFTSFLRYESALSHTHAHVTFRTLEVWVLTGFNFLNRRPPRPIDSRYLCSSPVSMLNPNGLKLHHFCHFQVRTCTAPYTRTCNFSDPGGLVAHGFQLFEQESPCPTDSRYLCSSPVSMLSPKGLKLCHYRHFSG